MMTSTRLNREHVCTNLLGVHSSPIGSMCSIVSDVEVFVVGCTYAGVD